MWLATEGSWTRLASLVVTLFTLITLMCHKRARDSYPMNMGLLAVFTIAMAFSIGTST